MVQGVGAVDGAVEKSLCFCAVGVEKGKDW